MILVLCWRLIESHKTLTHSLKECDLMPTSAILILPYGGSRHKKTEKSTKV